jgi:hypothetical protein
MTEVVGQISASTIQGQAAQISQSASAISSDKFVFFGLLDGTRNTADDPTFSLDEQTTAIGALRDQMISAQTAGTAVNTDFSYQDGVGAGDSPFVRWTAYGAGRRYRAQTTGGLRTRSIRLASCARK